MDASGKGKKQREFPSKNTDGTARLKFRSRKRHALPPLRQPLLSDTTAAAAGAANPTTTSCNSTTRDHDNVMRIATQRADQERLPSWLDHYVQGFDSCIHDEDDTQKILVWTCDHRSKCGGLGDILYGMIMTFYMALLSNRTLVLPEHLSQEYPPLTDFLQPAWIHWNQTISKNRLYQQQQQQQQQIIRTTDNRKHPVLLEPCQHIDSETQIIQVQNNLMTHESAIRQSACFQQYCRQWGDDKDCSAENDRPSLFYLGFQTLFRWTPRVYEASRALKEKAGLPPAEQNFYIGVHVRTGQGETWDDPFRHSGEDALKLFYACSKQLHYAIQKLCNKKPYVYVAADNAYAKRRMLQWNVDDTNEFFKAAMDEEILHVAKSRLGELNNVSQAFVQMWGELQLLVNATCLVMSRSKFSFLARDLNPWQQQHRCFVFFDDCGPSEIQNAIDSLRATTGCSL